MHQTWGLLQTGSFHQCKRRHLLELGAHLPALDGISGWEATGCFDRPYRPTGARGLGCRLPFIILARIHNVSSNPSVFGGIEGGIGADNSLIMLRLQ